MNDRLITCELRPGRPHDWLTREQNASLLKIDAEDPSDHCPEALGRRIRRMGEEGGGAVCSCLVVTRVAPAHEQSCG